MVVVPLVQPVEEAVADQPGGPARASVTVTGPAVPAMTAPGAPLPRSALSGAVIDRLLVVTVKVTEVSGSPPDGSFVEECASAVGLSGAPDAAPGACASGVGLSGTADATPGASAIPVTAAAARIWKT